MLSSDDPTHTDESFEQAPPRPFKRRDSASERRQSILQQKHTDMLPQVSSDVPNEKNGGRQLIQLREENKRLHWEMADLEKEVETLHQKHQQEVEHYENHLQEMAEEQERLKQSHQQLERRYQELYHDFQSAVDDEAQEMVAHAARTIELTPGDVPVVLNDVMKTVELHLRQVEDKNTAESLYLMRQAQRKAKLLEQELIKERQQIVAERENLHNLQISAREQAEMRKKLVERRLRAQYTLTLTLMTTFLLILLPLFQIVLLSFLRIKLPAPAYFLLFVPIIICMLLAGAFSRLRSSTLLMTTTAPKKKADEKKKK